MQKNFSAIFAFFFILMILSIPTFLSSCASGAPSSSSGDVLRITLKISDAGEIDTGGNGYYAVLLNNEAEAIEVTNYESFTDFIRFDGSNFSWYHRQGNVPSPGYTWVNAGNMNSDGSISSDGKSLVIRIDLDDDTHPFNQYMESAIFTAHVITTDTDNSLLGRGIDTMGQGPSFDGNSEYTVTFNKNTGLVDPTPAGYPEDPLQDWDEKSDLPDFPYDSYDIERFSLELE